MKSKIKDIYRNMAEVFISNYDWGSLNLKDIDNEDLKRKTLYKFDEDMSDMFMGKALLVEQAKVYSQMKKYPNIQTFIKLVEFKDTEKFTFEVGANIDIILEWVENGKKRNS